MQPNLLCDSSNFVFQPRFADLKNIHRPSNKVASIFEMLNCPLYLPCSNSTFLPVPFRYSLISPPGVFHLSVAGIISYVPKPLSFDSKSISSLKSCNITRCTVTDIILYYQAGKDEVTRTTHLLAADIAETYFHFSGSSNIAKWLQCVKRFL